MYGAWLKQDKTRIIERERYGAERDNEPNTQVLHHVDAATPIVEQGELPKKAHRNGGPNRSNNIVGRQVNDDEDDPCEKVFSEFEHYSLRRGDTGA